MIHEHLNLSNNASGSAILWWININTGEEQPVFQESQLPGGNPRWSPDSKSFLLRDVVIKHDQFVTQLFLYDLKSESLVNLDPNDSVENICFTICTCWTHFHLNHACR